ncbi:MAG: hypothetical protein ACREPM_00045, partial [Gemmatimonadaceae bacterium]
MPLSSSDVLDAYRADLSHAGKSEFSDGDASWLAFGTLLQRAVSLPAGDRARYLQTAAASMVGAASTPEMVKALDGLAADGTSGAALHDAVTILATEAEDAGAFALATAMLDFARILVGLAEFRLQGRLLYQQSRIFRKIGETETSAELLDDVSEITRRIHDPELEARVHLGKAALARVRGNYPLVRQEYLAVLDISGSSDEIDEGRVHAHHGLLIMAGMAGDFDTALTHGALAVQGARSEEHRLELLQNLASACYDAGQIRSALHGHLTVLASSRVERVRISAFGGAAIAAARLGDARMVDSLARAAEPLLAGTRLEWELADMSREFADAYAYLRDVSRFEHYRNEGLGRAERGKYFEILHRLESLEVRPQPVPPKEATLTRD